MHRHCLLVATPVLLLLASAAHAAKPIELASGTAPQHPQQPQVAVDRAGGIHVVYGIGDQIRYCRSTDGGQTFSPPSDLPLVYAMSLGMRRGPRVAAGENFICVTAIGSKFQGGDG